MGMRAYIPSSSMTFSLNQWFDCACSSAISDREGVHQSYQASSEFIQATLILLGIKFCRAHSSFHKRKSLTLLRQKMSLVLIGEKKKKKKKNIRQLL